MMRLIFLFLGVTACLTAASSAILPSVLQGVGIEQKINAPLPLNIEFRDASGATVKLGSFFGKRPVVIAPVYYTCPVLCSQILSGMVSGLKPLSLKPGRDFEVVAFSINPAETPQDAAEKQAEYSHRYSRTAGMAGWHFLVGSQASIDALTQAIGFHYRVDRTNGMFIHAAGIMVATPEGKLERYFYGVEFLPKDLKLGLVEASHNRIGSTVDQVLLFCYHYDPSTGKYSLVVLNTLKLAAILTMIAGFSALFRLWRRDLKRDRQMVAEEVPERIAPRT